MSEPLAETPAKPIKELTRAQRRVLGVLVEKGFTTPEVYPLTLKATTSGCNQKSNRDPVVNYDEDKVETVLDELRMLGLVAIVHTESGRSARYRHYMRHRFTLSEAQLAILTELLLRGRQSLGELRTRASRMVPIDSLEQLRTELAGLAELKLVRTDGSLDRRGAEVDHALYPPQEKQAPIAPSRETREPEGHDDDEQAPVARPAAPAQQAAAPARAGHEESDPRLMALERGYAELSREQADLRETLADLKSKFEDLSQSFDDLRRSLGG